MPTYMVVKNNEIIKQNKYPDNGNTKKEKLTYNLGDDSFIECSVEASFVLERLAMGNVTVRWFAKKIDYHTPMYNDTVSYREVIIETIFKMNRRNSIIQLNSCSTLNETQFNFIHSNMITRERLKISIIAVSTHELIPTQEI